MLHGTWDHPYTDGDRGKVSAFLAAKGIPVNDYDVRYLANTILPANAIDVFLTADRKTIWNFRAELKANFGITVMLPSELLARLAGMP